MTIQKLETDSSALWQSAAWTALVLQSLRGICCTLGYTSLQHLFLAFALFAQVPESLFRRNNKEVASVPPLSWHVAKYGNPLLRISTKFSDLYSELGVQCLVQGHRGIEGGREHCTFTPPTYNPCWYWDSNPLPSGYKSDSLTIRPQLPFISDIRNSQHLSVNKNFTNISNQIMKYLLIKIYILWAHPKLQIIWMEFCIHY